MLPGGAKRMIAILLLIAYKIYLLIFSNLMKYLTNLRKISYFLFGV